MSPGWGAGARSPPPPGIGPGSALPPPSRFPLCSTPAGPTVKADGPHRALPALQRPHPPPRQLGTGGPRPREGHGGPGPGPAPLPAAAAEAGGGAAWRTRGDRRGWLGGTGARGWDGRHRGGDRGFGPSDGAAPRYKPPATETNPALEDPTPDYMNLLGMVFSMCGLMLKVGAPTLVPGGTVTERGGGTPAQGARPGVSGGMILWGLSTVRGGVLGWLRAVGAQGPSPGRVRGTGTIPGGVWVVDGQRGRGAVPGGGGGQGLSPVGFKGTGAIPRGF